jgi:uncharacterized RDD family membrane protein YckC
MGARMAAVIIDGLVLVVPAFGAAYLLSLAFPHHGFFFSKSGAAVSGTGSAGTSYRLALPGWLVISALSLSYFFIYEALRGQTIGKRAMRLRVRSASGGPAGLNAISARTVLRLLDALPFLYLLGALVAICSGSRRRRIGDWAAGTVVVSDEGLVDDPPTRASWRVALYPAGWLLAVLLAVFALGLGDAVGESEQAIALVQSYVKAREQGDARLACSMLTVEQQRELVAIQSNDYARATPRRCPAYILSEDPRSHLLNPALVQLSGNALIGEYTPLGAVDVRSLSPQLELIAVPEHGRLKLDMRGVERLGFLKECAVTGRLSPSQCACTFALMRVQAMVPERGLTASVVDAIRQDARRCQLNATA